jgi:ABC-type glycerol-3-phosphate transport system permease component
VGVVVAGLALVLVEIGVYGVLNSAHTAAIVQVGATTVVGLLAFALCCFWLERGALVELIQFGTRALPVPRRLVPQALQSA